MKIAKLVDAIKLRSARRVARALTPSENAIDSAIVASAELTAAIAQGRLDIGATPETGHRELMSSIAAMAALGSAREHVIVAHRGLTVVRDSQGMDGEQVGCHPGKFNGEATVREAAAA